MRDLGWREKALERITELLRLEPGWDSYQGKAISFPIAWFTLLMLETIMESRTPEPFIMPSGEGFLQVEWHIGDTDIELYVIGPCRVEAYRSKSGIEESHEADVDMAIVRQWLSELNLDHR